MHLHQHFPIQAIYLATQAMRAIEWEQRIEWQRAAKTGLHSPGHAILGFPDWLEMIPVMVFVTFKKCRNLNRRITSSIFSGC